MNLLKELNYSETDYVRVPKEWAVKLSECTTYEAQEDFFFSAIERKKKNISDEIDAMNENLVEFKAFGLRYKRELEKIYEEQEEILCKLWDNSNLGTKLCNQISDMRTKVKPLIEDVTLLEKELGKVYTWRIDDVIKTLDGYKRLTDKEKEILKYVVSKNE